MPHASFLRVGGLCHTTDIDPAGRRNRETTRQNPTRKIDVWGIHLFGTLRRRILIMSLIGRLGQRNSIWTAIPKLPSSSRSIRTTFPRDVELQRSLGVYPKITLRRIPT